MAFIEDLTEKTIIEGIEYLIIEDEEGTKKTKVDDLLNKVPVDLKLSEGGKVQLSLLDGTTLGDGFNLSNGGSTSTKQIEMTFDGVFVKWRYVGDTVWTNLFSITDISSIGGSSGGITKTDVNFQVGTVTTLPTGSEATAVIEETSENNFVLSLGLPRGEAVTVDGNGVDITDQIITNIDKNSSEINVTIKTNNNYVYGTLSSLSMEVSSAEIQTPTYNSVITFRTQNDIPMRFSQSPNVYMVGDDCVFGAFIPRVSTDYRIELSYNGSRALGKVYGTSYGWVANLSNFNGGDNIVSVAKTYVDNSSKLCYGKTTILSSISSLSGATDSSGKYYIDSATLVSLAYRGIKYEDSKYTDWNKTNDARTSLYSYAIALPKTATEQARYCVEKGWVLPKEIWKDDFSQLKKGDIIFYAETPLSDISSWATAYMKVGHVSLCSEVLDGIPYCYEVSSLQSVNTIRKTDVLTNSKEKICMIARPQLTVTSSGSGDFDVSDEPIEETTENFLENGNISTTNGNNIDSNLSVRTKGYINLQGVKQINLSSSKSNIVISNIIYYDQNESFVKVENVSSSAFEGLVPDGAKKVRFAFRKTDNSEIIPYEVDYKINYVMKEEIDIEPTPSEMTWRDFPRVTGTIKDNYRLVAKLVELVEDHNTMYVYGAIGQKLTRSLISNRAQAYPSFYTSSRMEQYEKAIATGKLIWSFDCVNMIKSMLWGWSGDTSHSNGGAVYASNGVPDVNADGFFNNCKNKVYYDQNDSNWSNIELGDAVWLKGHIGVYIGEGLVIECTPKWDNNVQISGLGNAPFNNTYNGKKRVWSGYGKIPYIEYLSTNPFVTTNTTTSKIKGNTYNANINTCGISENGHTTYSEAKSILEGLGVGNGLKTTNYQNTLKWKSLVDEIAPKFGIDPAIVMMMIAYSSSGDATLKMGSNGGYGLMQIERSLFVKGYKNPYTNKTNSGVQTLKYLDGTTEKVTLSMTTLDGNTDSGRRLQIKFGCHNIRENAKSYYWNIIHTLVAHNMGAGALNFICSKYICDKYGYKLVNSGSLSKQSAEVQAKVKEMLQDGDISYLSCRKWYVETGHTLLKSSSGSANNVESFIQYYSIENNQLPYFYSSQSQKVSFEDTIKSSSSKSTDMMGNVILGYPDDYVCSAPNNIPLGSKVLIQDTNTELDGKIFTVMNWANDITNNMNIYIYMKNDEQAKTFDALKGTVLIGDVVKDNKIVVTTKNCNIRKGDSTSYDIVGYSIKDVHFTWLKTMPNGWNKIDFKGNEAYVSNLCSLVKEV